MNAYQRQLLDKLMDGLLNATPTTETHPLMMLAAELKGAMQAQYAPQKPTPDADGWVENTGSMPECEITAVKLRCGEIRNMNNKRAISWYFAEDGKQRLLQHDEDYDITHYRPA